MRIVPPSLAVSPVTVPSVPPVNGSALHVTAVSLTTLAVGATARLLGAHVDSESRSQLKALGLPVGRREESER